MFNKGSDLQMMYWITVDLNILLDDSHQEVNRVLFRKYNIRQKSIYFISLCCVFFCPVLFGTVVGCFIMYVRWITQFLKGHRVSVVLVVGLNVSIDGDNLWGQLSWTENYSWLSNWKKPNIEKVDRRLNNSKNLLLWEKIEKKFFWL